jgi:hypothetical protein
VIFYAVKRERDRSKPLLPYGVLPFFFRHEIGFCATWGCTFGKNGVKYKKREEG